MNKPQVGTPKIEAANAQPHLGRRLISAAELPHLGIHLHLNHLRRMWTAEPPKFPRPTYVSERRFAWPEEALTKWLDERIAAPTSAKRVKA